VPPGARMRMPCPSRGVCGLSSSGYHWFISVKIQAGGQEPRDRVPPQVIPEGIKIGIQHDCALGFHCARRHAFRKPKDAYLFENALGDSRRFVRRRCPRGKEHIDMGCREHSPADGSPGKGGHS
jgi:hypothetical protein